MVLKSYAYYTTDSKCCQMNTIQAQELPKYDSFASQRSKGILEKDF